MHQSYQFHSIPSTNPCCRQHLDHKSQQMIDCVNLKCCEDNFTNAMIPTITNSCVLLRPDQTQSQQQQREQRAEREGEGGERRRDCKTRWWIKLCKSANPIHITRRWIIDLASNNTKKMSIVPIGNLEDLMFTCVRQ